MKLEILMSCMHQTDDALFGRSNITGDVLMVNQCDREEQLSYPTRHGTGRILCTQSRGLTKSRNMAIQAATGDICLLCDDDEQFVPDYERRILDAYEQLPQADVIIFKMVNRPPSFPDRVMRLKFPKTMKVSSWQISFRRDSLLSSGVRFDELLGAGTGNGAEEELKFLRDCQKANLNIYYAPVEIASVGQTVSTWFDGFTEEFFLNRGATTRYILGLPLAFLYGIYYVLKKRSMYTKNLTMLQAMKAILKGMAENKITRQRRAMDEGRNPG
jgi:glycosyltransferase involved in cell wall biosynthesis